MTTDLFDIIQSCPPKEQYQHIKNFLANGGDVDFQNKNNRHLLGHFCFKPQLNIVKLLINNGADIDFVDDEGESALNLSLYFSKKTPDPNSINIINYLLKKGANPNIYNHKGTYPLHLASKLENTSIIINLCNHGANINCINNNGVTPLHFAIAHKNLDNIKSLFLFSPDIHIKTVYDCTPFEYALKSNEQEIISLFQAYQNYQDLNTTTNINYNKTKKMKL